jgi:flavin reductase (DIM6/NTAB) family NADH-FMN oxidoreductase RutF
MIATAPLAAQISSDEFRDVIGRFASGVTVITTFDGSRAFGSTASAVSSLSLEPPMLLVCINRRSATGAAVARSGTFAVNILAEHQGELARRFASKEPDKFHGVRTRMGRYGEPLLEGALAQLECRVTEQVQGGTHTVFLAEVDCASSCDGRPLAYFRGRFGGLRMAS